MSEGIQKLFNDFSTFAGDVVYLSAVGSDPDGLGLWAASIELSPSGSTIFLIGATAAGAHVAFKDPVRSDEGVNMVSNLNIDSALAALA